MKLGIVTPRFARREAQGRVNLEIAAEALRQGHEIVLFSEEVEPTLLEQPHVRSVLLRPPGWLPSRLARDQVLALRSRAALRATTGDCDALLANGFVTWAPCDVNAVHFVHSSWVRSRYHPWRLKRDALSLYARVYNGLNAALEGAAFRRSGRIVAVSESVRRDLLGIGVPAARISVITNGVDTAEFHPGPEQRERFGLPAHVPIALFAGDLRTPRKNLDTVLRSLPDVPDLHLAVAGRHDGTAYVSVTRSLGIADRVHFMGFQSDMPALMRSADMLVFPSRYEACSLVLLEALASGLPVVTAGSAGGAELVGPEIGVVLEDSEDRMALAVTLRELTKHVDHRRGMGRAARVVAERHSWSSMAQRYLDLLQEVILERRGRAEAS
jgi:glycosyltransferase involved in cell wall biosynthesis